jgi:predicted lipopolysaccharide heptosyltransferase III
MLDGKIKTGLKRILIVRLSAIGDVINSLPVLCALRGAFPQATIAWVVEDKVRELLEHHPGLDRVFVFEKRLWGIKRDPFLIFKALGNLLHLLRSIRKGRFDVVLDLQGSLKGTVFTALSGAPLRIGFAKGFCKEYSHLFTNLKVIPYGEVIPRVEKYLSLLAPFGLNRFRLEYGIHIPPSIKEELKDLLSRGGYILMHPGTSQRGRAKRWHPLNYARLADTIVERLGLPVIFTGGPGEQGLVQGILSMMRRDRALAVSPKTLLHLACLIRGATLFIGSDSGPLHLASALDTPCVALFGPKDPAIYRPYNPRHRLVYKREMNQISVEEVFEAVCEGLEGRW